ncbi:MAG: hypothetical protein V3U80_09185 [Flavobacteriaceae bacterium]
MSDKIPTPQSEEVDLGKLFQVIGNGFKNMFNAIGNMLKSLLHYAILFLIFIKKHFMKLAAATILGGVLGYVLDMNKTEEYESKMVIETNFGSGHQLYSEIDQLNALIKNEKIETLTQIFNISKEDATSLTGFVANPYDQENNLLKEFDYYIQHTDTIYTKDLTAMDYGDRLDLPDYRFQEITAYAYDKNSLTKLDKGITTLIENDHYKNILALKTSEFKNRRAVLENNLLEIKTLRKRYNDVALMNANKTTSSGTNISLADKQSNRNKDTDLFIETNRVLGALRSLDINQVREGFISSSVSKFNIGQKNDGLLNLKWLQFAFYGGALMFLTILGFGFNNYLNNYQK